MERNVVHLLSVYVERFVWSLADVTCKNKLKFSNKS